MILLAKIPTRRGKKKRGNFIYYTKKRRKDKNQEHESKKLRENSGGKSLAEIKVFNRHRKNY